MENKVREWKRDQRVESELPGSQEPVWCELTFDDKKLIPPLTELITFQILSFLSYYLSFYILLKGRKKCLSSNRWPPEDIRFKLTEFYRHFLDIKNTITSAGSHMEGKEM